MVVAAVPLVLVGFLALIWLVATEPIWWPALENASAALGPVVGTAVRSLLGNIRAGINALGGWLDHQAAPAVQLTWGVYWLAYQRVTGVPGALNQAWQAINRVQTVIVPHALAQAKAYADAWATTLWQQTVGLAEQTQAKAAAATASLGNWTQGQLAQLHAQALNWFNQAEADASAAVSSLGSWTQGQLAQLHAQALNWFNQAEADLGAQVAGAEAQARELFNQAELDLHAQALNLEQEFTVDLGQLRTLLQGQLAQVAGTAAAATAAAEGEISQIRNSRCMKVCDILGGIGEALQGLELAGLLALLAEAYQNPEGAAATIQQDLVQPAEQAWGDVLGLFGIKAA